MDLINSRYIWDLQGLGFVVPIPKPDKLPTPYNLHPITVKNALIYNSQMYTPASGGTYSHGTVWI